MDPSTRNFLYSNPQYYETVYPEPNEDTPKMCLRMFARFLKTPPRSILDVGCGTGRDLEVLSRACPECWGVDFLPEMIHFAKGQRLRLKLSVGDMRSVRVGRTFDAIMCMGSAFMYALSNEDVAKTLDTFAAHAHTGTLLVLDINNAAGYLGGGTFQERIESKVDAPELTATTIAINSFDRRKQLLIRKRTWTIHGRPPVEDFCKYRLFFPAELEHLLGEKGFQVVGMFDNKELEQSDLSGNRLYVAAIKKCG